GQVGEQVHGEGLRRGLDAVGRQERLGVGGVQVADVLLQRGRAADQQPPGRVERVARDRGLAHVRRARQGDAVDPLDLRRRGRVAGEVAVALVDEELGRGDGGDLADRRAEGGWVVEQVDVLARRPGGGVVGDDADGGGPAVVATGDVVVEGRLQDA